MIYFKSFFRKTSLVLSLFLCCFAGEVRGAENDTHDFTQTLSQVLNDGVDIDDVTVDEQSYTVKEVKVTVNYNKSRPGATVSVKVGGVTFGSAQTINSSTTTTFTYTGASSVKGQVVVSSVNNCTSSSGNGTFKITNVRLIEGAAASTPSVTPDPTSLTWGTVLQGSSQSTKTISITGANLQSGDLTISATGGYSVTPTSQSVSGTLDATTLTVTPPSTSTAGEKNGKISISGGDLSSAVEINLTMTVQAASTVTWYRNGSEYTTTIVANGTKLTFPDNPSSCDAAKEFVGWTETPILTATNTKPTFVSSLTTINSAKSYYAVFATKTSNKYVLGTKDDLVDGRQVLIVNPSANKAMSGTESSTSGKLSGVDVSISASTITKSDATIIWTVGIKDGYYQFKRGENFLNSGNNKVYCDTDEDTWSVTANGSHYILRSQNKTKDLECYGGLFYTYNTGTSDYYQMDIYIPEYKNYITSCCTALGATGSISLSTVNGGKDVKADWSATTGGHETGYHVALYNNANDELISEDDVTTTTKTFSNPGAGTYYVKVTPTYSGAGSYCAEGTTTKSSTIDVSGNVVVTFKKNGGDGTDDQTQEVTYNAATTLKTLTQVGYAAPSCKRFKGWATSEANANAGTILYTDGADITATGATTLWASWEYITYTVTKGTGTGAATFTLDPASSVNCGSSISVTATPDASHKGSPTVTISPTDAGEVSGTTISNVTKNITVNVEFAAKETYTITWNNKGATTTTIVTEGDEIGTLPSDPSSCSSTYNYFVGWYENAAGSESSPTAAASVGSLGNKAETITIPSGNKTYYAVFANGDPSACTYSKIESLSSLSIGDKVVLVGSTSYELTGPASDATNSTSCPERCPNGVYELTVCEGYASGKYAFKHGSEYLAHDGTNKRLNTQTYIDAASSWTVSFDGSEKYYQVTLTNCSTSKVISFNSPNRFLCYDIEQTNYKRYLYKKVSSATGYISSCCAVPAATNVAAVVNSGTSVTVNWTNPSNVGAINKFQIINSETSVVVKDNIAKGNANESNTSGAITGLTECDTYKFKVVSVGSCDTYSEEVSIQPYASAKTVTFNYHGGSGTPASKTSTCDESTMTLPTPERTNYDFKGWFTAADGGTQKTNPYTIATEELHAQWTQNTVNFSMNGKTGTAPASQSGKSGSSITLPNPPIVSGYHFDGWYDNSSGGTHKGNAGDSYTLPSTPGASAVTLFAHWSEASINANDQTFDAITNSAFSKGFDISSNTDGSSPVILTKLSGGDPDISAYLSGTHVTVNMNAKASAGNYSADFKFSGGGAADKTITITIHVVSYAQITISSPQVNSNGFYCKNTAASAGFIYISGGTEKLCGYYPAVDSYLVCTGASDFGGFFHCRLYDITAGTSTLLTRNNGSTTDYQLALNLPNNGNMIVGHTYQLHFNDGFSTEKTVYTESGVPYQPTVFEFTVADCSKPTALQACPINATSFTANWYDATCASATSTIKVMQAGDAIANVALGYSSSQHSLDVDGNILTGDNLVKPQDWGYASSSGYYDKWLVSDQEYKNNKWQKATPAGTSNGIRLEKASDKAFVFTPRMGELKEGMTSSTIFKVTVKAYYYNNTHSLQCFAIQTEPNWDISPTSGVTAIFNGVSTTSWTSSNVTASSGTYVTYSFTVSGLSSSTRLGFGCGCYDSKAGMALSAVRIEPISEVKSVNATCSSGSAEITGLTAGQSYFYTVTNNGNTSSEVMVDTRKGAPTITYFPSKVSVQTDVNGFVSQIVTFKGKNFTQCDLNEILATSTPPSSPFTVTPGEYTYDKGTGAVSGTFTVTYHPTSGGEHTSTYSVGGVTAINLLGRACPDGFGNMATGASAKDEHSATIGWNLQTTGTVMLAQGTRTNTELLANGGFELGSAGWDDNKCMTGDVYNYQPRTGTYSRYCTTSNASIYVNNRSGFCGVYSEEMKFVPGTYHAEAYVRHAASSSTTGPFNLVDNDFYIGVCRDTVVKNNSYVKFTSVKANADYAFQFNSQSDEWKKIEVTFTLTETLNGRLFIARPTSTVAYFFLDDVSLKYTAAGALDDKSMFVDAMHVSDATSANLTGLKPQTSYSYYIVSEAGCESNIATFTTDPSDEPVSITATPNPITLAGPLGMTVSATINVSTTNAYAQVVVGTGTCTDGHIRVGTTSLPADGGVLALSFTPKDGDVMGQSGSCQLLLSTTGAASPTEVTVNWTITSGFDESTPVVEVVDISNSGMNVEHNVTKSSENTSVYIVLNRETTEEERVDNVGDEIFFSKYYEANQNVKLVAIFNPTNEEISLAGTYIWLARDASHYWGHTNSNKMSLASYGKKPGFIGPMEEIIFYRYESNVENDRETIECAAEKTDMSSWNRVYNDVLSFSGNDALLLVRDITTNDRLKTTSVKNNEPLNWRYLAEYDVANEKVKKDKNFVMLDMIGARTDENYPSNVHVVDDWVWKNCKATGTPTEEGDGDGWVGYGQDMKNESYSYYDCGSPNAKYGYLLSTNRCLLIRLKTVKSGCHAVELNEDDFYTLDWEHGLEWQGVHVPLDRTREVEIGCDNFSFVGGYDYAGYYNKWTPLSEEELLPGLLQPDGSWHIAIPDGTPHFYCKTLCIQVAEKTTVNGVEVENVHVSHEYKVPIVVDKNTNTSDATVFRNADHVSPINTLTQDICNDCDVVVRDKKTLTNVSGGQQQFHSIELYAGSKLDLNGQNMTLKEIRLDSKNDTVSYAIINKGGSLSIDSVTHVKRINYDYWYPFSLPYDCKINTIRQLNGKTMGKYEDGHNMVDSKWGIKYYDGEARQESNQFAGVGNTSPHWHWMSSDGVLQANVGYIIGLFDEPDNYGEGEGKWKEHRSVFFPPMSGSEYTESNSEPKTAYASNWAVKLDGDKQNHGWNFVGQPFISIFDPTVSGSGQQGVNASVMIKGIIGVPDYTDVENVYVSVPDGAASRTFTQKKAANTKLEPFKGYFVQVIDPTDGNNHNDIAIVYDKGGRTLNLAPRRAPQANNTIDFEVLFGANDEPDNAGIVVGDQFSTTYELGFDLVKMSSKTNKAEIYTTTGGYNLAYNALKITDATNIPVGLYAPSQGSYTIRLDEKSDVSGAETIELLKDGAVVADLLFGSYTLQVDNAGSINGYSIRVTPRQEVPGTATDMENVDGQEDEVRKVLIHDHIYILRGGAVYDITGKQMLNR